MLGGDKDGPNLPELARHISETIAGAQLALIPNAWHVPHLEMPGLFNRELLTFLKSTPPLRRLLEQRFGAQSGSASATCDPR